jgi:hypothetical protein
MLKIGVLLMLFLPALLATEMAIMRLRPKVPGQQVVIATDGSLQFDPRILYSADPTHPAFARYLFPIFLAAFAAGVALLLIALTKWLLMRRRTI